MSSIPHRPQPRSSLSSYKARDSWEREDMNEQMDELKEHIGDSTISNTSSNSDTMELASVGAGRGRSPVNLNRSSAEKKTLPKFTEKCYRPEPATQGSNWWKYLPFILCIAVGAKLLYPSEQKCTYEHLSKEYPQQDTVMWCTISTTIENILNKRKIAPAVNLFIHQGGSAMEQLVNKIAKKTSECFGGRLVEMTEDDFTSANVVEDYGHAIDAFKNKIKDGRVAVIVNLNKIPPEAARALHTICDTHTPVAKEIVIFLTLVTATAKGNPVANAENTLEELWASKLKRHELDPLITRVTDQVLALRPLN